MAMFIHMTDERTAHRILRAGIRQSRTATLDLNGTTIDRVVFCVPVVPNFQATFQWTRELKRGGHRVARAVQFRIDDHEMVLVGHFGRQHDPMTASQAVAVFLRADDPWGLQVLVPRAISPREIIRLRSVPQVTGWRFYPSAKGRSPLWPRPGDINASRLRWAIENRANAPWVLPHRRRKR